MKIGIRHWTISMMGMNDISKPWNIDQDSCSRERVCHDCTCLSYKCLLCRLVRLPLLYRLRYILCPSWVSGSRVMLHSSRSIGLLSKDVVATEAWFLITSVGVDFYHRKRESAPRVRKKSRLSSAIYWAYFSGYCGYFRYEC